MVNRWKQLKDSCENGENRHIVEQIKEHCKLSQNKTLPYLERCEGGFGGNDNSVHKQIRFRPSFGPGHPAWTMSWPWLKEDNDIVLHEIHQTELESWTYEELDDIIYGFIKTAQEYVESELIDGYIEVILKQRVQDDDYYV